MENRQVSLVRSTNSRGSLSANSAQLPVEKFTKTETAFLIGRMISVYREKPGASMEALVSEWHDALRFCEPEHVADAWRDWRNTQRFFPSIAEILNRVRALAGPSGGFIFSLPAKVNDDPPFCQDGRTEAEEIAHRAAVCLSARKKYGFGARYSAPDEPDDGAPKPASQDGLSPALIELTKRQGIYRPAPTPNQQDSQ